MVERRYAIRTSPRIVPHTQPVWPDLDPTPVGARKWTKWDYAAVWYDIDCRQFATPMVSHLLGILGGELRSGRCHGRAEARL